MSKNKKLLSRLREIREKYGKSPSEIERDLIFGPGWIERIEEGEVVPKLDTLLAILNSIGSNLEEFAQGLDISESHIPIDRFLSATELDDGVQINFKYAKYDAAYYLKGATLIEFETVLRTLRNGLDKLVSDNESNDSAIKTDAVATSFLKAVELWPDANPSDIWWFIISRAYMDPFNHPAEFARLDLSQSWKRTAGWALEEVIVRHYGPTLKINGIELVIASGEQKEELVNQLDVEDRVESDKIDILLVGNLNEERVCFGVLHVKSSFAERRTDDVPLSQTLIRAGYCSPLWTLDCKSIPSEEPINHGELGDELSKKYDTRSAKRKDIEDDGYFSACFSYNTRTRSTPDWQDAKSRIYVCNLSNSDDAFSDFILDYWNSFRKTK